MANFPDANFVNFRDTPTYSSLDHPPQLFIARLSTTVLYTIFASLGQKFEWRYKSFRCIDFHWDLMKY